ncbi:hypothetical protein [Streptomyces sp. NBC_00233]|nr:hypothetical protein [Streptomyces sp. NBC_00233]MCX5231510.1 hypothetical protein [Streptomyces sp. NBC_00233]
MTVSWWVLSLLHGIHLPAEESGAYLNDGEQLRACLTELRKRGTT